MRLDYDAVSPSFTADRATATYSNGVSMVGESGFRSPEPDLVSIKPRTFSLEECHSPGSPLLTSAGLRSSRPQAGQGLGLVLQDCEVFEVSPGGAAQASGNIFPGDRILQVDGRAVTKKSLGPALSGPAGDWVVLKIQRRDSEKVLEVRLERQSVLQSTALHSSVLSASSVSSMDASLVEPGLLLSPQQAGERLNWALRTMQAQVNSVHTELAHQIAQRNSALRQLNDNEKERQFEMARLETRLAEVEQLHQTSSHQLVAAQEQQAAEQVAHQEARAEMELALKLAENQVKDLHGKCNTLVRAKEELETTLMQLRVEVTNTRIETDAEVDQFKSDLTETQEQFEISEERATKLEKELAVSQHQLQTVTSQNEVFKQRLEEITQACATAEARAQQLAKQLGSSEESRGALEATVAEQGQELARLVRIEVRAEEQVGRLARADERIASLTESVNFLEGELSKCRLNGVQTLEQAEMQARSLRSQLETLQHSFEARGREILALEDSATARSKEEDSASSLMQKKLQDLEQLSQDCQRRFEDKVRELQAASERVENTDEKLQSAQSELHLTQGRLDEQSKRIASLTTHLDKQQEARDAMQKSLSEAQGELLVAKQELALTQQQHEKVEQMVDQERQKVAVSEQKFATLQAHLNEVQASHIAQLQSEQAATRAAEAAREEKALELSRVEQQFSKMQTESVRYSMSWKQQSELLEEVKQNAKLWLHVSNGLQPSLTAVCSNFEQMQLEHVTRENENDAESQRVAGELREARVAQSSSLNQLQDVQAAHQRALDQIQELREARDAVTIELRDRSQKLTVLESHHHDVCAEAESVRDELQDTRELLSVKGGEVRDLQSERQELLETISTMQQLGLAAKSEYEQQTAELERVSGELKSALIESESCASKLAEQTAESDRTVQCLSEAIEQIQSERELLRSEGDSARQELAVTASEIQQCVAVVQGFSSKVTVARSLTPSEQMVSVRSQLQELLGQTWEKQMGLLKQIRDRQFERDNLVSSLDIALGQLDKMKYAVELEIQRAAGQIEKLSKEKETCEKENTELTEQITVLVQERDAAALKSDEFAHSLAGAQARILALQERIEHQCIDEVAIQGRCEELTSRCDELENKNLALVRELQNAHQEYHEEKTRAAGLQERVQDLSLRSQELQQTLNEAATAAEQQFEMLQAELQESKVQHELLVRQCHDGSTLQQQALDELEATKSLVNAESEGRLTAEAAFQSAMQDVQNQKECIERLVHEGHLLQAQLICERERWKETQEHHQAAVEDLHKQWEQEQISHIETKHVSARQISAQVEVGKAAANLLGQLLGQMASLEAKVYEATNQAQHKIGELEDTLTSERDSQFGQDSALNVAIRECAVSRAAADKLQVQCESLVEKVKVLEQGRDVQQELVDQAKRDRERSLAAQSDLIDEVAVLMRRVHNLESTYDTSRTPHTRQSQAEVPSVERFHTPASTVSKMNTSLNNSMVSPFVPPTPGEVETSPLLQAVGSGSPRGPGKDELPAESLVPPRVSDVAGNPDPAPTPSSERITARQLQVELDSVVAASRAAISLTPHLSRRAVDPPRHVVAGRPRHIHHADHVHAVSMDAQGHMHVGRVIAAEPSPKPEPPRAGLNRCVSLKKRR